MERKVSYTVCFGGLGDFSPIWHFKFAIKVNNRQPETLVVFTQNIWAATETKPRFLCLHVVTSMKEEFVFEGQERVKQLEVTK